ncbi:MAG: hypothetical protein ABEJ76_07335 [Halanaeroarchaeum sp.]
MPQDTPSTVYSLRSNVSVPIEEAYDFFDAVELPDGIDEIHVERRTNRILVDSVPADDSISKYTPTAQLKASVVEKRVYEEQPEREPFGPPPGSDEEEEIPSELVEFVRFAGRGDEVLRNSTLQYEMFTVLRDLALEAEDGELTAITAADGELEATKIVEGDEREASIEVVEQQTTPSETSGGVDWRENEYIK